MTDKPRRLGRGLDALLGEVGLTPGGGQANAGPRPETATLPIGDLAPGPHQPRQRFDDRDMTSLVDSVRAHGLVQPILARPDPAMPGRYQIVAGERRWRAAQRAQLHDVPVVIRELTDAEALEIALIENIQRADLNPIEEAQGYDRLIELSGERQEDVGRRLGKSRSYVTNMLRLLTLPDEVQDLIADGALSAGHGRALLAAADPAAAAKQVVAQNLNVRQTEKLAPAKPRAPAPITPKSADTLAVEADLSAALGLKVTLIDKGEKGEVRIAYTKLEQLDLVIRRLKGMAF